MSNTQPKTISEMQSRIEKSWADFNAYLQTLTPDQLTRPTDAAGWTAKDHVIHLAHWQNSMAAMLNREDRPTAMGIDKTLWNQAEKDGNFDPVNAVLQQRTQAMPLDEVMIESEKAYQNLMKQVLLLTDDDLQHPYTYFQPDSSRDVLVDDWLYGNTVEHYDEHQSYIEAIVAKTMTKDELLQKIETGWNDFNAYLMTLTPPQVTVPTDAAGWTALDHVIHIADWENGVLAMLNKGNRAAAMGVDQATWQSQDFNKINDVLQKKSKDKTLPEARMHVMSVHQGLVDKVQSMTDEDLQRPYKYYQPESDQEAPVIRWIQMNTYEHYTEHTPWIAAIVNDRTPLSKSQLLAKIQKGWDELNQFLANLSDEQKTQPTDAAGWTVKDHMIHMAVWESGVVAMLNKQDRVAHMGVDRATWDSDDDDQINAVIQKQHQNQSLESVEQQRQTIHSQLIQQIESMSDEDLQLPVKDFDPQTHRNNTISGPIIGNTYMHYADHIPWMGAIAAGGSHE